MYSRKLIPFFTRTSDIYSRKLLIFIATPDLIVLYITMKKEKHHKHWKHNPNHDYPKRYPSINLKKIKINYALLKEMFPQPDKIGPAVPL